MRQLLRWECSHVVEHRRAMMSENRNVNDGGWAHGERLSALAGHGNRATHVHTIAP
jgi:hypothetical protein